MNRDYAELTLVAKGREFVMDTSIFVFLFALFKNIIVCGDVMHCIFDRVEWRRCNIVIIIHSINMSLIYIEIHSTSRI